MPNWCYNKLVVTGNQKDLNRFKGQAIVTEGREATALSIENFFPTPQEALAGGDQMQGNGDNIKLPDWYNWRVENWGSKWDINATLEDEADNMLQYGYDSAWAPVNTFLGRVSEMFPNLEFRVEWQEPGMCFSGEATYKDGEMTGGDDSTYTDRFGIDEDEEDVSDDDTGEGQDQ